MKLTIEAIPALTDNYIWAISQLGSDSCVMVDPSTADPVFEYLERKKQKLVALLITHHHYDHTGGIGELVAEYTIPVYGPKHESIPYMTHPLDQETGLEIPSLSKKFNTLNIPGHTSGHIAYYTEDELFCGDTLFAAGCGRIFEGTPVQMLSSLQKLLALPDPTEVYCAHEYTVANLAFANLVEPENSKILARMQSEQKKRGVGLTTLPSTIALEKQTNPFFRVSCDTVKQACESYAGGSLNSELEVFTVLRNWKNNWR